MEYGQEVFKLSAVVLVIAATWLGAWVARRLTRPDQSALKTAASANAAAGGFLLGAGLFHFLPESHAHFEELYPGHEFPIGFALCALGFTVILMVERLLFDPEGHALEEAKKRSAAPVLAIALSAHAILAGIAVGTEGAAVALLSLAAALSVHKFAAAFTLGSTLIRGGVSSTGFRRIITAF